MHSFDMLHYVPPFLGAVGLITVAAFGFVWFVLIRANHEVPLPDFKLILLQWALLSVGLIMLLTLQLDLAFVLACSALCVSVVGIVKGIKEYRRGK